MPSDEQMTRLLARAFDPGDPQPPGERVAALRAHVLAAPTPRKRPMALRRAAVGFAVLAALGGGVIIGHELPRPLRDAARAVGIPGVESSALVDAREELHRLGQALAQKNWPKAAEADRRMLRLVKELDDEEQAKIVPEAHEIHVHTIDVLRDVGYCTEKDPCPPPLP